jgi:hypothetical protein
MKHSTVSDLGRPVSLNPISRAATTLSVDGIFRVDFYPTAHHFASCWLDHRQRQGRVIQTVEFADAIAVKPNTRYRLKMAARSENLLRRRFTHAQMKSKKLDRSDVICGFSARKIRDFLGGTEGAFRFEDHCEPDNLVDIAKDYFGDDATAVLAELFKRGWMIKTKVNAEVAADSGIKLNAPIVALTQVGKQSRVVSFTRRFSRADGGVVVVELIERAKAINANDDLLCGVAELRLFGSMLDPKAETVGDVDVAFSLYRKKPPAGLNWSRWNFQRADATGRHLQFIDRLCYGEGEVKKLLRARKPRLSLQTMFHFEELKPVPKFKVIFKRPDDASGKKGV